MNVINYFFNFTYMEKKKKGWLEFSAVKNVYEKIYYIVSLLPAMYNYYFPHSKLQLVGHTDQATGTQFKTLTNKQTKRE